MPEGFREKTSEELEDQVKQVSEDLEQEITQKTSRGEVFKMSLEEIKEKFPVRYKIYLKILRANKSGAEISEDEKQEMQEWLGVLNNLDNYIENHHLNGEKTLREKQITVFEDMRDFLEQGGKDGYIKLPTGAGKTVIFSEFIEATGLKTLIVVPTKILVGQTEEKLEEFAEDLDVGKIYSGAKEHGKDVTIITYQSLIKRLEDGTIKPEDYQCLILDEAHTSLSEKRIEAVDKFKHAIRLGFTATPQYSKDKSVGQILNTEIHSLDVKEAAEEGVVSPFSVILAETNIDIGDIRIKQSGEYSEEDLEKIINTEGRNNSAVELYEEMFNDRLAIAYCSGIKHANEIARLFNKKGIRADVISGKQSTKEQTELLQQFKQGEIRVLCNADILIAGFDEPKASVCLNLRPTLSPVIAEQRGGRVLRLNSENPDKHATIVDFVDKSENKKIQPITFAEIAGASVVHKSSSYRQPSTRVGLGGGAELPEVEIEGLKVVTNAEEVMRIVNRIIEEKGEPAPEGWITNGTLAERFKVTDKLVAKLANEYKISNPEWFKEYLGVNKRLYEHYSPDLTKEITKKLESEQKAPEGWKTKSFLENQLKKDVGIIERIASRYRGSNPDWFHDYLDTGNRLNEHYAPELVEIISNSEEVTIQIRPEGWMTRNEIAEVCGRSSNTIFKLLDSYREQHPDWFKNYALPLKKGVFEHYAPELTGEIKRIVDDQEIAPVGWINMTELQKFLKKNTKSFAEILEGYRETNPEWFHQYLNKGNKGLGKLTEHYSLELATKIKEKIEVEEAKSSKTEKKAKRDLSTAEKPPENWTTAESLRKELRRDHYTVKQQAEKFRAANPEWFKEYLVRGGKGSEYYSPELAEKIRELLPVEEQVENAPEGWLTRASVAEKLEVSEKLISTLSEKYRTSNPEWFKRYLGVNKRPYEHFSPDLIVEINRQIQSKELSPEGWMTNSSLSKQLDISNARITIIADKYRTTNPHWFKIYTTKENKEYEHYAPDLVVKIKEELQTKEQAPEGWISGNTLSKKLNLGVSTLHDMVEKYRTSNPEWFQNYLNEKGHYIEHYSPKLIQQLTEQLENRESAPEGWMSASELRKETGFSYEKIAKIADKYRPTNPDWLGTYFSRGKEVEYYSPGLIEKIKADKEGAPEGWMTSRALTSHIGISDKRLQAILDKYRPTNPDWFKNYTIQTGRYAGQQKEHCAPELIEKIKEDLKSK